MIDLNDTLFIAEGSHRATYRHPEDPDKCLKIVKKGTLKERRKKNKKWYKRLRKLSTFDDTPKDIKTYLHMKTAPEKLEHIPCFYGMVNTNLGPAMLLERISNEDGSNGRHLRHFLGNKNKTDALQNALIELGNHLIKHAIIVRDFSTGDVVVRENQDGTLKLFVVDGLGVSEFIPLNRIPSIAKRTAARRVNRFFGKILQAHPELTLPHMSQQP